MKNLAYCDNCGDRVEAENGYCNLCGAELGTRRCANGHVMDPSWTECQYCHAPALEIAPEGEREEGGDERKPPGVEEVPKGRDRPKRLDQGATILDDPRWGSREEERTASGPFGESPVAEPAVGPRSVSAAVPPSGKNKTVFDPGLAAVPTGSGSATDSDPTAGRLVGWLVTFALDPAGREFRLTEGRNVIGADPTCDVCIASEPCISARHAVVMFRQGELRVRDHDSTNGTFVNGEDIFGQGAVVVRHGDRIRLGTLELTLYVL